MTDDEIARLAQLTVVGGVGQLTAELVRLDALPPLEFVKDVAAASAETLVKHLDLSIPLDGYQARILVRELLQTSLEAMVGALGAQNIRFAQMLAELVPSPLPRPPEEPPA